MQIYKLRSNYRPKSWLDFAGSMYVRENRNTSLDIGNLQHNRSFSFSSTIMPEGSKIGLDLSYDYNDVFSQTNICFVATPSPLGSVTCGTPFLQSPSVYSELSHFGSASVFLKPMKRLTANVGYTITNSDGNTLILNPITPTGPLSYNYHLPMVNVAFEMQKHLTFKAGWNYYDYGEKSDAGPTLPRDFRSNVTTLSLRYTM
jgi:hypothetical protein